MKNINTDTAVKNDINFAIITNDGFFNESTDWNSSVEKLCKKLQHFNFQNGGIYERREILIQGYDKDTFVGGILGKIAYKWLYIDLLFVEEKYRKKGIGSSLLGQIEGIAIKEGIRHFHLNTGSFQVGPRFYEKHGYEIFAKRDIFTNDGKTHIDYFMKKEL